MSVEVKSHPRMEEGDRVEYRVFSSEAGSFGSMLESKLSDGWVMFHGPTGPYIWFDPSTWSNFVLMWRKVTE